jgi:transposase
MNTQQMKQVEYFWHCRSCKATGKGAPERCPRCGHPTTVQEHKHAEDREETRARLEALQAALPMWTWTGWPS